MKKITTSLLAIALVIGLSSCKENTTSETVDEVTTEGHSHDEHGMHDHDKNDNDGHSHDADGNHVHDDKAMEGKLAVAMGSKSGSNVSGTIMLKQAADKVMMEVNLTGLTPGEHAMHIHANGDCSSDDGKSAGGHWNPTTDNHGKWGHDAHHMGDIGNLVANDEGAATLEFSTDKWCIGCDDETKNIIGKAFIVHASADDFESQPSGAAGARVACGVIK